MKKLMFLFVALIVTAISIAGAFAADDCIDCCDGPCDGDSAATPTLDVEECIVRINDRKVSNDVTILKAFERGEELEIKVEFVSSQEAEDVQIMAWMTGYHRGTKFKDMVIDMTPTFDIEENVAYEKTLELQLPDDLKLDSGDELKIRIEISDKYSSTYVREYNLKIEAKDHNVVIQDIVLDPYGKVQAGRGLFANVRIKNMGEDTEESIKVTTSIPALDIKATEYIDELDDDEATTSEDMFLRIPSCTEAGEYVVKATVEYADGDEEVTKQTTILITEDPACELSKPSTSDDKTVVTVPGRQDVVMGTTGTVYPIILENRGFTDRSYELLASGVDSWATYRFDPGTYVLLKSGETKTVYLYLTPSEGAAPGEKVFMVSVKTDGDEKQIALTANVVEGEDGFEFPSGLGDLKDGLMIGLIVLIVLIIILGLVVIFNKAKGNENEPEELSGQTYY